MYDCFGYKRVLGKKTNVRNRFVGSLIKKYESVSSVTRCLRSNDQSSLTWAHIHSGYSAVSSSQVQYSTELYHCTAEKLHVVPIYGLGKQKIRLLSGCWQPSEQGDWGAECRPRTDNPLPLTYLTTTVLQGFMNSSRASLRMYHAHRQNNILLPFSPAPNAILGLCIQYFQNKSTYYRQVPVVSS